MISHKSPISGVATFKNELVATAGYDNLVILWDLKARASLNRGHHDHLANQCEFNRDGTLLASSSSDNTARIWSVPDMRLMSVLRDHEDDVEAVAFHPHAPLIATSSRDGCVRVFELDGRLRARLEGHGADVISVDWSGDGQTLISSGDDGTVRRWDVDEARLIDTISFDGVETDTIALTPEGLIVAGNDNGQIIVMRGTERTETPAHDAGIKRVIYDEAQRILISLSYDRSAKFWHLEDNDTLALIYETNMPDIVWPRSCAFADNRVIFATFGSSFAIFDADTGEWDLSNIDATSGLNAICFDGDVPCAIGDAGIYRRNGEPVQALGSLCNFIAPFAGKMLSGGQAGRVFDADSGAVLYQHRSPLNCVATGVARDGRARAVVGSYTGEAIILMESPDGTIAVDRVVPIHENAVKGVAISGDVLFSVCATGAAAAHSLADGCRLFEHKTAHTKIANGCAALPDGRFATISRDRLLRVWRGDKCVAHITPHRNSIKCVACSIDGRWFATGDYGGRVGVFDIAAERYVTTLRPTATGISSIAAAPAGGFLASSYDGNLYPIEI